VRSALPSPGLLIAALAGLCEACGEGGQSEPVVTATRKVPALDANTFDAQCAQLDGVVQFHAHCGGYNLCRGESYDSATEELSEHTCRGLNTCAGMSCVELQSDRKREAAALYAQHCASCHGEGGSFELPIPTGSNLEAEAARFAAASTLAKSAAIAFAEDGGGIALEVPHAFYRELSRAEVLRLVAYIDTLTVQGGSRAAPKRL
jgi:Cytochrome C oxidase, cbb3-type, subunit III